MRPTFMPINRSNSFAYDSILFGDTAVKSSLSQFNFDFFNLLFGKLLKFIMVSTFFNHIKHIVSMCTKKEMRRIATTLIITMMKSTKVLRDRAMGEKPDKSMSINEVPFISKVTIALSVFSSCPFPAVIRTTFFDFIPESTRIRAVKLPSFGKVNNRLTIKTNSILSHSRHILLIPQTL